MPVPPSRSGYTFSGWNTKPDGSGTLFNEDTVVTASLTVYAPSLTYNGTNFTYDLGGLSLTGTDQAGDPWDLSGETIIWAVNSGLATVSGNTLTITGSGIVEVIARVGTVTSNVLSLIINQGQSSVIGLYTLTPLEDPGYQTGATMDGIPTMTVNSGISGFKYFGVQVNPVIAHNGQEVVVFVHLINNVQLSINATKADFDVVQSAQAGFNVGPGDMVKIYIVDDLTNRIDINPIIMM